LADDLERLLRLSTRPVAVKLYESAEDLPRRPLRYPVNICQLVSMARHQGRVTVGTPELIVCAIGAACVGLIATPEFYTGGQSAVGVYCRDLEAGARFMANTFKVGDTGKQYEGILLRPLADVEAGDEPDVVLIYGNAAQMMRLIHATAYDNGEKVTADTVCEASLCSAIGFAKTFSRPIIAFPCTGERSYGGTQDAELVYAAPYALVRDKLVAHLKATESGGVSVYPVPPNMLWTPSLPPQYVMRPEYLE